MAISRVSIILLFFVSSFNKSSGQQIDFMGLVELTSNYTFFERKMIELGNYPVKIDCWCTGIYREANSDDYKERFYVNYLDEKRRDCSDSLNIDSSQVAYTREKHNYAYFSEKYDKKAETGFTHYYWNSLKLEVLKGEDIGRNNLIRKQVPGLELIIEYAREQDYLNIVKEINSIANYKETKEIYFDNEHLTCRHIYSYSDLRIEIQRLEVGGIIYILTKKVKY